MYQKCVIGYHHHYLGIHWHPKIFQLWHHQDYSSSIDPYTCCAIYITLKTRLVSFLHPITLDTIKFQILELPFLGLFQFLFFHLDAWILQYIEIDFFNWPTWIVCNRITNNSENISELLQNLCNYSIYLLVQSINGPCRVSSFRAASFSWMGTAKDVPRSAHFSLPSICAKNFKTPPTRARLVTLQCYQC